MKKWTVIGIVAALIVVSGVVAFVFRGAPSAPEKSAKPAVAKRVRPTAAKAQGRKKQAVQTVGKAAKTRSKSRPVRVSTEDRTDLSPGDKRLLLGIERAQDEENLEMLRKLIAEASASTNAEVRSDLVDALGWFGKDAILDLLPLMADADDGVRESAIDNWTSALGEIDDTKERGVLIESVMKVIKNEDALEAMMTELSDFKDVEALQVLVNVIDGDGMNEAAVKAAKEHYEFVTGEKWKGVDAAEAWLRDNMDDSDDEQ